MVKPKVEIAIDTREQDMLEFPGMATRRVKLDTGDYALIIDGQLQNTRVERKSKADLFGSFKGEAYLREKAKIARAHSQGLLYVLAVEASASSVRMGHGYRKRGEWIPCQKTGQAQLRQLMTISHRYGFQVVFCQGRDDMALWVSEFLLGEAKANGTL